MLSHPLSVSSTCLTINKSGRNVTILVVQDIDIDVETTKTLSDCESPTPLKIFRCQTKCGILRTSEIVFKIALLELDVRHNNMVKVST